MPVRPIESQILQEIEEDLSADLRRRLPHTLLTFERMTGRQNVSVQSFHGIIGGKNNQYTDAIRSQFANPDDFNARWLQGLIRHANEAAPYSNAATRLARWMQNRVIRDYTLTFLTRNFYRNLIERIRQKPEDHLWRIWFGDNQMSWGLFIAPAYRDGEWTNDKSEIRRAVYDYWTVGHVLATGIIDPDSDELLEFDTVRSLHTFYQTVLRRCSASHYEQELTRYYVQYLRDSDDVAAEPFLIPELRYDGRDAEHKYRLDFTILNPHVMTFTGFEVSPASTHMAVKGTKKKTQKVVNNELKAKWEKEMAKRNRYFRQFGITTVTFTDEDLTDVAACFEQMRDYLSHRPDEPVSLEHQIESLEALDL